MESQNIELQITGLTAEGAGVGRDSSGKAIFVPGALPGETVTACVMQRGKRFSRAALLRVEQASPARIVPACPLNADCGGCPWQHLAFEQQLEWKRQLARSALQRIGGLDVEVLPTLASPEIFAYRSRVQLHALRQGGRLQLGFYERGSHEGTNSCSCLLMRPVLADINRLLNDKMPGLSTELGDLRHVALRCDGSGEQALLTLVGMQPDDALRSLAATLLAAEKRLLSVWANWGPPVYGIYGAGWAKLAGEDKLPEQVAHLRLEISPAAFTQVNHRQALRLYELVAEYAGLSGAETVLDVYSGVGMIGLYLADKARQVIGIENYAPAIADAEHNARLNNINNCRFETGAAEVVLPRLQAQGVKAQVVVVDPPRAGCAPAVVQAICGMEAQRIVYVSCDPATLARDLRLFSQAGYAARQVQPLDMFPHSGHVECAALLCRAK